MRFSVSLPMLYRGVDVCESISSVAKIGYDAVEIFSWQGLDLARVRDTLDETGVEMVSMCTTDFRLNNPLYRGEWLDALEKSCVAANALGAKKLITQVGQDTCESKEKQREAIITTLKSADAILSRYGVTVMLEPLNILFDHKGYYMPASADAFGIINEVNSPFVKVIYDIYHQQISEGNVIPTVLENLDSIAHFHAAGHPGRRELWMGESNYGFIFDEIDKTGYSGCCGLEYKPTLEPNQSLAETLRRYVK